LVEQENSVEPVTIKCASVQKIPTVTRIVTVTAAKAAKNSELHRTENGAI